MDLGSGIKPDKAALWAQALAPSLLPGERIHALIKGTAGGALDDLVAITDLRVLSAQTQNHCRIKSETPLKEIVSLEPVSGLRGNALQITLVNGEKRRLAPKQVMGKDDVHLAHHILHGLLTAGTPDHLRAVVEDAQRADDLARERLATAEKGLWPNTIVVGSRPRKKAAASILAHARPGEDPWLLIGSLGAGVLAAFDDRLVLIKTGAITSAMAGSFGGERAATFHFHEITGIEYNSGLMAGVLEILTPSYNGTANKDFWRGSGKSRNSDSNDPYTLSNTLPLTKAEYAQALPHLNELRQRVTQVKRTVSIDMPLPAPSPALTPQPPPQSGGGLADEITKIAGLRDSGVLTEEEFQTAKTRLLGL